MYSSYIKVNKLVWRFKKAHEAVTLWGYQDTWLNKAVALSQPGYGAGIILIFIY